MKNAQAILFNSLTDIEEMERLGIYDRCRTEQEEESGRIFNEAVDKFAQTLDEKQSGAFRAILELADGIRYGDTKRGQTEGFTLALEVRRFLNDVPAAYREGNAKYPLRAGYYKKCIDKLDAFFTTHGIDPIAEEIEK
jgi:hypothetical protein